MRKKKVFNTILLLLVVCLQHYVLGGIIENSFTFVEGNKAVATVVIGSKTNIEEDVHLAGRLSDSIKKISGVTITVVGKDEPVQTNGQVLIGKPNDIPLLETLLVEDTVFKKQTDVSRRHLLPDDLGEEGFIIHRVKKNNKTYLILTGNTNVGVLYAVNTLIDRLHMVGNKLIVDGLGTRLVPVVNTPALKYRSLYTQVGPGGIATDEYISDFGYEYRDFIDWLASHKINNILLQDTARFGAEGICYDSTAYPELVNHDHPNVQHEYIGGIISYGRTRGVKVFLAQNLPDNWGFVIEKYRDLYGINLGGEGNNPDYDIPNRTVCLTKPEVKTLWDGYWNEVMDRYPDVEAVGAQFGETASRWCQCEFCRDKELFFAKVLEFYDSTAQIARSKNPQIKTWIWLVPGARDIIANRNSVQYLTMIDWDVQWLPFVLGHNVPRGQWYLYHGGKDPDNSEFSMKQMCMAMKKYGMDGLQIRAVAFRPKDRLFQHFGDFAWNPELSIDDYAYLYTIKVLRRKDSDVAGAYAHYIRARGYYEIVSQEIDPPIRPHKRGYVPAEWIQLEDYRTKMKKEIEALNITLKNVGQSSDFVNWLNSRAGELTPLVEQN